MKTNKGKILKFQYKPSEILTTEEIMKVFSGLVRLIQKSAEYSATAKTDYYISKLNETTAELNKRNRQVEELLKLNEELLKKCKQQI